MSDGAPLEITLLAEVLQERVAAHQRLSAGTVADLWRRAEAGQGLGGQATDRFVHLVAETLEAAACTGQAVKLPAGERRHTEVGGPVTARTPVPQGYDLQVLVQDSGFALHAHPGESLSQYLQRLQKGHAIAHAYQRLHTGLVMLLEDLRRRQPSASGAKVAAELSTLLAQFDGEMTEGATAPGLVPPGPAAPLQVQPLVLSGSQLSALLDFLVPGEDPQQLLAQLALAWRADIREAEGTALAPAGLYAWRVGQPGPCLPVDEIPRASQPRWQLLRGWLRLVTAMASRRGWSPTGATDPDLCALEHQVQQLIATVHLLRGSQTPAASNLGEVS